jgi:NAD(P)-dependent dehydrogenase (short-subunit alcohol dehydrogenase family)
MQAKMLDGKVAIVSGASYGMGYTMAELFAKEGAKVVMTARGPEKLDSAVKSIRDQGYEVTGVVADNKNLDDVKKVIQTALDIHVHFPDVQLVLQPVDDRHQSGGLPASGG